MTEQKKKPGQKLGDQLETTAEDTDVIEEVASVNKMAEKAIKEGAGGAGGAESAKHTQSASAKSTENAESTESAETFEAIEEDALAILQNELVRAQEDVAKAEDRALRAMAEVQNTKRRAQQDVEKAHKFALEKFVESLLPVVDSLELGLKNIDGETEKDGAVREGLELTHKLLVDTLAKHNVEQLNPIGEPLDPNYHQAMTMVPNPDMKPNTIMDVVQKGYLLNGRVVRPAMVVVSN